MAEDLNQLYAALEAAHKAGDVEGARQLAQYIQSMPMAAESAEAEEPSMSLVQKGAPFIAGGFGALAGLSVPHKVSAVAQKVMPKAFKTAAPQAPVPPAQSAVQAGNPMAAATQQGTFFGPGAVKNIEHNPRPTNWKPATF